MRPAQLLTAAFLFAGSLMVVLPAAQASHYALSEVSRLVSAGDAEKLHKAGVDTTEQLLEKTAKSQDRKELAKASGLSASALMALAKHCDLLRIKGVGPEMVLLLEAAGVKGARDLGKRNPAALVTAIEAANKTKKISEKLPTEPQLADWIDQAKMLPPALDAK